MNKIILSIFAAITLSVSGLQAETYSFFSITDNNAANAAAGEAQLTMEVTSYSGGRVLFKFLNSGPAAMSITDIYFDDGTLLAISEIIDSGSGVDFDVVANPKNLPGAQNYNFQPERNGFYNSFFSLDSDSPVQPMGVNPGEWVGVVYSLQNGQTFADVLNSLAYSQTDIDSDLYGGLRVGIHIQGFANGGSEAFINGPANGASSSPVPDSAATAALLGLALLGIGIGRRCLT